MRFKVAFLLSVILHSFVIFAFLSFVPEPKYEERNTISVSLNNLKVEREKPPSVPQNTRVRAVKKKTPKRKKKTPKRVVVAKPTRVEKSALKSPVPKEATPETDVTMKNSKLTNQDEGKKETVQEDKIQEVLTQDTDNKPAEKPVEEPSPKASERDYGESFVKENLSLIREVVRSYLVYPPIARRMGWEGTVLVRFLFTPEGEIEELLVEKSSGFEILDSNALRAVRLAAKEFPKPERKVFVVLPIVYRLE
ncbi:protein TonB [Hydrogenivirga caldilitoris]|uniref:Protein TonB n=1 Tax=Hydrogenivirga caldilitoris TaxID=246264 RepID=A0A497XML0_9AQUI|nr:energy transducer TonB [Hydrogenivirga caldilitoris]RLJ70147.1 protein TonB [Hydrogenivirga caldilitoris]